MSTKLLLGFAFFIAVVTLLAVYWFIPLSETEFSLGTLGGGFTLNQSLGGEQFYQNMRFSESPISYKIYDCPLNKKTNMIDAFGKLSDLTILNFYESSSNEDISVYCDSSTKIEEGLFIAGEGGPTNITKSGEFNIISKGRILLFRESSCAIPNIAIHELLHVLGFDHVDDHNNIMYPVAKCSQEISQETIKTINTLYSVPSLPDLIFEEVGATMRGKYLDVNMSVRNAGLDFADKSKIKIYADGSLVKEFNLSELDYGHGKMIVLTNIWVSQLSVQKIYFEIESSYEELKKENNNVELKIKNKN